MTVSSTVSKSGPYAGAGTTGPFTVGFRFLDNSHLRVVRTDSNGANTDLVLDTDYTVLGAGANSGSVTLTANLTDGQQLTIVRAVPATQEADYVQNDAFPAESHETALDKLTMLVQQNAEAIGRSVKVRVSDSPLDELPAPSARANTVVGFDATGNLTVLPVPSSLGAGDLIPFTLVSGVDFNPGDTSVTLPRAPGSKGNLQINFDASGQEFSEWNVSGVTVTFASPIPVFVEKIWGYIGTTLSTEIPPGDSVGDDQLVWGESLTRVCENVAELRALPRGRYKVARTLGYYAPGDGGDAHFYQDESDTTTPDNGGSVIEGDSGARWKIVIMGDLNIRQFGAKGDNSTINTTFIRSAVANSVGRRLHVPPGNPRTDGPYLHSPYLIDDTIEMHGTSGGYNLYGDTWCWDFNWGPVGGSLIKNVNGTGKPAFSLKGGKNGLNTIRDLGIIGSGSDGDGIYGEDLYNTTLDHLLVSGQGANGIRMKKCFNSHIDRCHVGNVRRHGIWWNGLANAVSTRRTVLFGCDGDDAGYACMRLDGEGGNNLGVTLDSVTFEPNTALSTHCVGLHVSGTDGLTLQGNCYFELFPDPGRLMYADATVRGLMLLNVYFQDGRVTIAESTFGRIIGCKFHQESFTTALEVSPPAGVGANAIYIGDDNYFTGGALRTYPRGYGTATLSSGVVVVNHSNANPGVPVIPAHANISGTPGHLFIGTVVPGVSFEIRSSSASDNSDVNWKMQGYN